MVDMAERVTGVMVPVCNTIEVADVRMTGQKFEVSFEPIERLENKEVEVLDADGVKVKGILKAVDGNDFTVGVEEKVKVEGKKRTVKQEVDHVYQMDKVKYTKYIISFK